MGTPRRGRSPATCLGMGVEGWSFGVEGLTGGVWLGVEGSDIWWWHHLIRDGGFVVESNLDDAAVVRLEAPPPPAPPLEQHNPRPTLGDQNARCLQVPAKAPRTHQFCEVPAKAPCTHQCRRWGHLTVLGVKLRRRATTRATSGSTEVVPPDSSSFCSLAMEPARESHACSAVRRYLIFSIFTMRRRLMTGLCWRARSCRAVGGCQTRHRGGLVEKE